MLYITFDNTNIAFFFLRADYFQIITIILAGPRMIIIITTIISAGGEKDELDALVGRSPNSIIKTKLKQIIKKNY